MKGVNINLDLNCKERPWWAPEIEAVLAIGSLALFAWGLQAVILGTVPEENEKYVMLMLGALNGTVKDTFGRYLQVTKGGVEARETIAKMAAATADTAATAAAVASQPAPGTAKVNAAADVEVEVTKK